uniref:DNA-directed RNA polymerase subunit beta n=1 Tax=Cyanidium sp. THAL103 TaxID=3027999 RepID=A0A9Y1I476_9RHOD|nr:RNA polymerase beta subunit [Cyanidium sp. THAL103]
MRNLKNNSLEETIFIDLISIQRSSYYQFLIDGFIKELDKFSPVVDYTGKLELKFLTQTFKLGKPKYSLQESKRRDTSYSIPIYISVKLSNKNTGEIKEQEIFLGEIPLMTEQGTFLINGSERVIVNQIVRSPGVYFKSDMDRNNLKTYSATIISNKGAWLKYEIDKNDLIWVRIDKTKKISISIFFYAMGLTKLDIDNNIQHADFLHRILDNEKNYSEEEALIELYKKIRPNEPSTIIGGKQILYNKFFDHKKYDLGLVGRYKINKKLKINVPEHVKILTLQDVLGTLDYLISLKFNLGVLDDIDHLSNRRVRSVGELLHNQVRIGFSRLERLLKERLTICDSNFLTPANLINTKPLIAAIKEFFSSSQLSQFMDQVNPLAELTHKRRISALGPGGLTKERAGFAVRDIHPSHYGRICPIETPEGPNAGLIGSLALYAKVNNYGFIEAPFYRVRKGNVKKEEGLIYLSADEEDDFKLAPADIEISDENDITTKELPVRYRQDFIKALVEDVNFIAASPIQVISAATSLIPFLEHNDANRALMGSNMQRQAVPLISPRKPLIGTGLESKIAKDSGMVIINRESGFVKSITSKKIVILSKNNKCRCYSLQKYRKSNQDTCINQRPLVWIGEYLKKGQILADGASTEGGELALGHNILVAYMPWEGYNYEDAFLISERLVYEDLYTSIHIEKYEIEIRQTKLGPEKITRDIPNVAEYNLKHLDEKGVVTIGSFVEAGNILVGKVTPKGETDQPPEGKLLRAIFGEKARDVKDTSLRLPNGTKGRVVDIRILSKDKGDDLTIGTNIIVKVYIAQKRKLQVGDKMAGRHGNKGIISRILPRQDMPYLPDGRIVDIVLNPLGVPSRMNVGQLFECLLGLSALYLNKRFKIVPFDEMYGKESSRILINQKLQEAKMYSSFDNLFNVNYPGKIKLIDGRTGNFFDNPITVGCTYMLKLVHLVDDKIHARSTGPYSLVTQQPLGGKAQQGGQRLGEMEVWALEAFGASYTLQELLTIKSDDIDGRNNTLNAIIKGKLIPNPGIPESFKVLMRELQSLGLDIAAYKFINSFGKKSECVEVNLMFNKLSKHKFSLNSLNHNYTENLNIM